MPRPLVGKLRLTALQVFPCRRRAMSEYYRNLDAVAQSRYLVKLKLLDLEEKDDLSYCRRACAH